MQQYANTISNSQNVIFKNNSRKALMQIAQKPAKTQLAKKTNYPECSLGFLLKMNLHGSFKIVRSQS